VEHIEFMLDGDEALKLKGFNISPCISASFVGETGNFNTFLT